MFGSDKFKDLFLKYKDRPILLYGDPDVDGLISLLLMTKFCDMFSLPYKYIVNEHRFHGFAVNPIDYKGYMIIASDFTITRKELSSIIDNNIVLLSTDHHECESDFIYEESSSGGVGLVINNQYPFESEDNRYLSGAGVFYELICSLFPEFKSDVRDALVGITLLSDIRPTEGSLAHKYLKKTFSIKPETPYINYLIKNTLNNDFGFGVPKLDRNFIDYTLNPTINALLRFNKTDDAVAFILGLGLNKDFNARSNQATLLESIREKSYILDMPSVSILAVDTSSFSIDPSIELSDFIGLFCSDYKDKTGGKSTLGFTLENGVVTRASFRGRFDDIHYLAGFRHIELDANGHRNAFGIKNFVPTQDTWIQINDLISELESNHERTITIYETSNLAFSLNKTGNKLATENCYVRDYFRSYYKYKGSNAKVIKETYKMEKLSTLDIANGVIPEVTSKGCGYKYLRDSNGNKIPKYIEYLIDGRRVKSFGVSVYDGLILPILERGYMQLYVRPMLV